MSKEDQIEVAKRQVKKCNEYLSTYGEDEEVRHWLEYAEAFLERTTGED